MAWSFDFFLRKAVFTSCKRLENTGLKYCTQKHKAVTADMAIGAPLDAAGGARRAREGRTKCALAERTPVSSHFSVGNACALGAACSLLNHSNTGGPR